MISRKFLISVIARYSIAPAFFYPAETVIAKEPFERLKQSLPLLEIATAYQSAPGLALTVDFAWIVCMNIRLTSG